MAKKKSKIKDVVETVESWVGMGPKAKKKAAKKVAAPKKKAKKKSPQPKTAKKKKKSGSKMVQEGHEYDRYR